MAIVLLFMMNIVVHTIAVVYVAQHSEVYGLEAAGVPPCVLQSVLPLGCMTQSKFEVLHTPHTNVHTRTQTRPSPPTNKSEE